MNKFDIRSIWFCCEFRQLHLCQILLKLAFISHCSHESHRGELFLKHSVVLLPPINYQTSEALVSQRFTHHISDSAYCVEVLNTSNTTNNQLMYY